MSDSARPVTTLVQALAEEPLPVRIRGYDGTDVGPRDASLAMVVTSPEALRQIITAPGDLGLARAYLTGNLLLEGVHPGDPYRVFRTIKREMRLRRPSPADLARLARDIGPAILGGPPTPPAAEGPARWKRNLARMAPTSRAAKAIAHHYDVSNAFYESVLGPSMTYTCAVYRTPEDTLEEAQEEKYRLVAEKLGLKAGMRLLDVGCGWGGMVRFAAREYGVKGLGVTLSREQAAWGQAAAEREGLAELAEIRHLDYRHVAPERYDAVSSIGLTEHVGVKNYPAYFAFLRSRLVDGGRLLNHCITRPDPRHSTAPEPFTDRYVFPDGQLASVGTIILAMQRSGLEVHHVEGLRIHYANTLAAWSANLEARWDECVAEVGEQTAKVWGLYIAGSRLGFETNGLQLHQVLATADFDDGRSTFPLRPDWQA